MNEKRTGSEVPFEVGEIEVRGCGARKTAVVFTPKKPMVFDRERLARLNKSSTLSPVERWMIDQARQRGSQLVLLRATNPAAERVWFFAPELDDAELEEGGYSLTGALLPMHRQLVKNGVVLMVHTDWGLRESFAMRRGVQRYADDLLASHNRQPEQELDLWILKNMLLHVALSLEHVVGKLLPSHLAILDRRWLRVQQLISRVRL